LAGDIDQATGARPAAGRPRDRLHLWALVEVFVLSGFAIAQPLLDVTGRSPDFFLFRRAGRLDIVLLVLAVILLPPLVIWGFEVAVGLVSDRVRRFLHLAVVTALVTLLTIGAAKRLTEVRGPLLVMLGLAGGVLAAVLYSRQQWMRLWLR
jgi:hypothetical protein